MIGLRGDGRTALLLWAVSAALIALPLARHPARLVLNLLPYTVLFALAYWALGRWAPPRAAGAALLALAVVCIVPAYGDDRTVPVAANARIDSPVLWSVTLQNPDQAVANLVRLPRLPDGTVEPRTVVARLDRDYRGAARLLAWVNGVELGTLEPLAMGTGGVSYDEVGTPVPAAVLALRPITEVVLRQSAPDPSLRIVTYAFWAGATLGADASWFFDGSSWHRGVVQPLSGFIVPGSWIVELQQRT